MTTAFQSDAFQSSAFQAEAISSAAGSAAGVANVRARSPGGDSFAASAFDGSYGGNAFGEYAIEYRLAILEGVGASDGAATVSGVGEDAAPVADDDGSNVWQRRKRKPVAAVAKQDFDKHREAARLAIEQLEQDDDALVLLMMAA